MIAAAVHVRAGRRRREGAEVEGQGSGRLPGGVPPPESIKHLIARRETSMKNVCHGHETHFFDN